VPTSVVTTGPFSITTPASSTVTNGVTNIDLSQAGLGLGVQAFGPVEVNLLGSAARKVQWRPGFAGTLTRVSCVLSGATVTVGAATVAVGVAGVAATLDTAISFAIGQAAGAVQDRAVTALGAFTADQIIDITPAGANTAATFGGVVVEYTRA
jgi:hypothetical protein